ncbi:hypothetical protein DET49_104122 [Salegentibacter sp. 24]|uniref:hypothetical protein n=1 Tax=Salegentibacter sp. 24 TaxID=2183986 RepID=UPI00105C2704|nr:hypothetical protein [Salegentibacter sp. 24]TDN93396.1 hypothetical protein DET49_104122 [Salegentibacter sp. 24]
MNNNKKIFDLNQFQRIEDIIFIDEPILTHYKRNDKHFLLYLVDTLDKIDKYIMLEVEEQTIYQYLTKSLSLRDLILQNKNIGYFLEQDFKGNILDLEIIQTQSIDNNYLPLQDSFLEYQPSVNSYYYKFIKEYESDSYLLSLRQDAFYVKFAPNNTKYADTIGLNELATDLLSNLSKSFKSFLKADFFIAFKELKTDNAKLKQIFNRILPDLDFRMVDLKYGSFEVGLAVDKIMKNSIQDRKIKDWALDVGYKYKNIVLDEDYDEETVNHIINSYDEEDRKRIFNPIFKITQNPNYSLQIKDSKNEKYSTIKIKNTNTIEKILPPSNFVKELEDKKEYGIVQFTTLVDKNNISQTVKIENTLFNSTDNTDVILTNKEFEKYGYEVNFEISIPLNIRAEKDTIFLTAIYDELEFQVVYHSDKIVEGMKKITSNIFEYILNKSQ